MMKRQKHKYILIGSLVAAFSAAGWYFKGPEKTIQRSASATPANVPRELPGNTPLKESEATAQSQADKENWLTAFEPLTSQEKDEVSVVHDQIRRLNMTGRIDSSKMDEFRSLVFKYQERILADAGRRIILESPELAKTKEGADTIVSLIDTLAYFGRNGEDWPLAIDILRDIGTRPLTYSSTLSSGEESAANITMQAFEQFARYRPDEAMEFISSNIEKEKRSPYIAYFKTGLALAGLSKDDIYQKISRLM